jgi:hypothetical protein
MTKFMVLYRSEMSAREMMGGATPEQAQAGMDAWMNWAAKAAANLGPSGPSSPHVTGFSILQADSADALRAVLDGHPHLEMGGSIEILEFLPIPGM